MAKGLCFKKIEPAEAAACPSRLTASLATATLDEETGGAAINEHGGATLDTRVGRPEFDIDSEGVVTWGGRDFKLAWESSFPGWVTKTFRSRRGGFRSVSYVHRRNSVVVFIVFNL